VNNFDIVFFVLGVAWAGVVFMGALAAIIHGLRSK
jgi:hypothetical protein